MVFAVNANDFEIFMSFSDKISALFRKMDEDYAAAAERYGFICTGCTESCCQTLFYHHTLIEYTYLHAGLQTLETEDRRIIRDRALNAVSRTVNQPAGPVMCPLNQDGRCRLYDYRPMICRLHGLPHELHHPVKGICRSPGCHEFEAHHAGKPYVPFDRTPLYRQLAELETSFRQETGFCEKIKMTITEMIIHDEKKEKIK